MDNLSDLSIEELTELAYGPQPAKKTGRRKQQVVKKKPVRADRGAAVTCENTDIGNARRFVAQAAGNMRYLVDRRKWLYWTGQRWELDRTGKALRLARQAVKAIYAEASEALTETDRKALAQHAMRSESESKIRAMVSLAQSEPEMPITFDELDRDPWLLNCLNGTIDLKTGELREHRREDYISKLAPTEYDPDARSALWESFLDRVLP